MAILIAAVVASSRASAMMGNFGQLNSGAPLIQPYIYNGPNNVQWSQPSIYNYNSQGPQLSPFASANPTPQWPLFNANFVPQPLTLPWMLGGQANAFPISYNTYNSSGALPNYPTPPSPGLGAWLSSLFSGTTESAAPVHHHHHARVDQNYADAPEHRRMAETDLAESQSEGTSVDRTEFCASCNQRRQRAADANRLVISASFNSRRLPVGIGPSPQHAAGYGRAPGRPISSSCTQLMDGAGHLGAVGADLAQILKARYADEFTRDNSLSAVCPRFNSMKTDDERIRAWVWFWTVLANEESGCTVQIVHPTVDRFGHRVNLRPGYGLWAMEMLPVDRVRAGRGAACDGNIRTSHVQASCAASIMDSQLRNRGGVLWGASYWGPVERYSLQISPNMRLYKGCF